MTAWCDFGDLPADQCACPKCKPDTSEYSDVKIKRTFTAQWASSLACGHGVVGGDTAAVTSDGDFICMKCAGGHA